MLKRLFTSTTRIKLLTLFLLHPEETFYMRELARRLDEQINAVRRELENLHKLGLLKATTKNRKKYYIIKKEFPIYSELRNIILKNNNHQDAMIQRLQSFGEIERIVLAGYFVDQESSVDLLLVGKVDREQLENYLNQELQPVRPLRFSIMGKDEYDYRKSCNDQFLHDLLSNPENIIIGEERT